MTKPPDIETGTGPAVYPMPAYVTFTVTDMAASIRWYVDGLGFTVVASLATRDGALGVTHLRREKYQDLVLVPARGAVRVPLGRGVRISFAAGGVDLVEIADRARAVGGGTIVGPAAAPWSTHDLVATDPDGYTVVLTGVYQGLHTRAMAEAMRRE